MTVTVLIATYNRAVLLEECLSHLCRQRFEPGDEVIVVDNGSSDGTAGVVTQYVEAFPVPLRYLHEPRPGKSYAVMRGARVAAGDVLALTDDDVNVDENWLAEIRRAMADNSVALIGGPVRPRWESPPQSWLRLEDPRYAHLATPLAIVDYGPEPADLGERTAVGANLAVRRQVFERVGGFATSLGKLRGTLMSGEDDDLCRRVRAAGYRAVHVPGVIVNHWVPASRTRLGYFVSWFFWWGITTAVSEEMQPSPHPPSRMLLHYMRRLMTGTVRAAAAAMRLRPAAAVCGLLEAAFAAGYIAARVRVAPAAGRSRAAHRSPVMPARGPV